MPRSRYKKSDENLITLLFSSKCITFIFFILSQSIISGDCPCIFYSLSSETIVLRYLPYFCATKTQWRSMNSTLPLLIADEIGGVPVGRGGLNISKNLFGCFFTVCRGVRNVVADKRFIIKIQVYPHEFFTEFLSSHLCRLYS